MITPDEIKVGAVLKGPSGVHYKVLRWNPSNMQVTISCDYSTTGPDGLPTGRVTLPFRFIQLWEVQ